MSDAPGSSDALVTIARFLDPTQAQFAKGMIESCGISCVLQGVHANGMMPLAFRARLQVFASDETAARELLRSAGDGRSADEEEDFP